MLKASTQEAQQPVEPEPGPGPEPEPEPVAESVVMSRTKSSAPPVVGHWSEVQVLILDKKARIRYKKVEVHSGDDGVWEKPAQGWQQTDRYPATVDSVNFSKQKIRVRYDNPVQVRDHALDGTTITLLSTGQRLRFATVDREEPFQFNGVALNKQSSATVEGLGFSSKAAGERSAQYYANGVAPKHTLRPSQVNPADEGFGGKHDYKREEAALNKRR